jgi:hypothetical protein
MLLKFTKAIYKDMTEQQLKSGMVFTFEGQGRIVECEYRAKEQGWTRPFRLWIGGKLFTYKTFRGLSGKANSLMVKFEMKEVVV